MMSERGKRRLERLQRIKEQRTIKRVRVVPRDDVIRRDIRHGVSGARFPESEGSVEWPFDQFTKRRLRDGTVTLETPAAQEERKQEREQDNLRYKPARESSSAASPPRPSTD